MSTTDDTDAYIEAQARVQGLTIEPAWKENVAFFFNVARTMAKLVEETGALTDAEAAPVFMPKGVE